MTSPNPIDLLWFSVEWLSYGTWFWWVAGIAVVSLLLAVVLYLAGRRAAAGPEPAMVGVGGGTSAGDG